MTHHTTLSIMGFELFTYVVAHSSINFERYSLPAIYVLAIAPPKRVLWGDFLWHVSSHQRHRRHQGWFYLLLKMPYIPYVSDTSSYTVRILGYLFPAILVLANIPPKRVLWRDFLWPPVSHRRHRRHQGWYVRDISSYAVIILVIQRGSWYIGVLWSLSFGTQHEGHTVRVTTGSNKESNNMAHQSLWDTWRAKVSTVGNDKLSTASMSPTNGNPSPPTNALVTPTQINHRGELEEEMTADKKGE